MLTYDMATSKGLVLACYVDPTIPPRVMLDSSRVQQVLLNLLSNSIKFTQKGHVELTVIGRWVDVQMTHPGNAGTQSSSSWQLSDTEQHPGLALDDAPLPLTRGKRSDGAHSEETALQLSDKRTQRQLELEFTVRDTGIGISSEQLQSLFKAFSQVSGGLQTESVSGCMIAYSLAVHIS